MKKYFLVCAVFLAVSCNNDEILTSLETEGVAVRRENMVAWFPENLLPEARINEIADTINMGIELAERYIGGPYDWQVFANRPIRYYFCPGNFMSTTTKEGDILISAGRAQNNTSPWLHETMHILLRSKKGNWSPRSNPINYFTMPMWLTEGMAEYLSMKISYDNNIPKYDLFGSGGYLTVDSVCNIMLKDENGPYILKYIGDPGIMIKLFTRKRRYYAPGFYNCSCSFTRYLAETYGFDKLLAAFINYKDEIESIEEYTGKNIRDLKEEWLNKISKELN